MRVSPASRIRQPLVSPVAVASIVPTCAALLAFVAWSEMRGPLRYAVLSAALVLIVVGVRLTWRVAKRETERLR